MIVGIGIDMVDKRRIAAIYAKFGLRFARKILHLAEMRHFPANTAQFLASRFAAKEAVVKALGCGFAGGVAPAQIEIAVNAAGQPELKLHGRALERANALGASRYHVSISHERHAAIAMAILED